MHLETIGVSSCSSSRDFQKQPFSSDEKASVMGSADLPSVPLAARASWGPFSPSRAGKGGAQKGSVSTWDCPPTAQEAHAAHQGVTGPRSGSRLLRETRMDLRWGL